MKPVQQVLGEEPETDDQSVAAEGYETPPEEPCMTVQAETELAEKEQHGSEPVELAAEDDEQKVCPDLAEVAH